MKTVEQKKVIAFYGFKGGAGRSMLLVNLAVAMASQSKRVLIIDCDLEAPGVGDYLLGSTEPYALWRRKKGIIDIITSELDVFPRGGDGAGEATDTVAESAGGGLVGRLFEADAAVLNPDYSDGYLRKLKTVTSEDASKSDAPEGTVYLLGPGTHEAEVPYPWQYAKRVLNLDWNSMGSGGAGSLKLLGDALRSQAKFDYVLIDARTGYSQGAVALLQNWATDLVAVGTPSSQSIDGIARMLPVFSGVGIRCYVAISKGPTQQEGEMDASSESERDRRAEHQFDSKVKTWLIEQYHGDLAGRVYNFPFLDDLRYGDDDLWSRWGPDVMEDTSKKKESQRSDAEKRERDEVRRYATEVYKLLKDIDGQPVDSRQIGKTFRGKNSFSQSTSETFRVEHVMEVQERIDNLNAGIETFLVGVERFCSPEKQVAPPTNAAETRDSVPFPNQDMPPLLIDGALGFAKLAARDYARVELATKLLVLDKKPEEYEPDRVRQVRLANGVDLLPVSERVLGRERGENRPKQGSGDTKKEAWKVFGAVMRDPSAEGMLDRIGKAREALSSGDDNPDEKQLAEALDLAELLVRGNLPKGAAEEKGESHQDWLLELGRTLLPKIEPDRAEGNFRRPRTPKGLAEWNSYDVFSRYAAAVRAALLQAGGSSSSGLVEQLQTAERAVMAGLCKIDWDEKEAGTEPEVLRFFDNYLEQALQARRVWKTTRDVGAPHSLMAILFDDEKEALQARFGANTPDGERFEDLSRSPMGSEPDERRLAYEIKLRGTLSVLLGHMDDAVRLMRALRRRVALLDHPSHPAQTLQIKDSRSISVWANLFYELARIPGAANADADASEWYRLALRTYMPIRRARNSRDELLTALSASLVVSVARIGPTIDDQTINELKDANPGSYSWWPAARLFAEGRFTEALHLLSNQSYDTDTAVLSWRCRCESALANPEGVARFKASWWGSRLSSVNLFSDQLGEWLLILHVHAGAYLAEGDPEKASDLLEDALKATDAIKLPSTIRLGSALRVRLSLAQLRALWRKRDNSLLTKAAELVQKAATDVVEFFSIFQVEVEAASDQKLVEYVSTASQAFATRFGIAKVTNRAHGDPRGVGFFTGRETQSPLRRQPLEVLVEFAEILFYAERREDLEWVTKQAKGLLKSSTDVVESGTPHSAGLEGSRWVSYDYIEAASSALVSTRMSNTAEKTRIEQEATELRDRDNQLNPGRHNYYDRIFSVCWSDVEQSRASALS